MNAASLTSLESKLLMFLRLRRGKTVSRSELLTCVWGYSPNVQTRTVDIHIQNLRRKTDIRITSIRNVGYRLDS